MIKHLSSIAEVVEDFETAVNLYRDILGMKVQYQPGSNYAQIELPGVLHFGIWSREAAAETVLGDAAKASQIPLGFMIGLEVEDVYEATAEAEEKGLKFLQESKTEDWGQTTSRFLAAGGGLCELSETP